MDQRLRLALKPRLVMTAALRQSLEILQMPQADLAQWLLAEIERNPLLELVGPPFTPLILAQQKEVAAEVTLHEHLLAQIRESFSRPEELRIAKELLGRLDEKGYLETSIAPEEENVLSVLQTFDPPGIFARSLQECLLLQLRRQNLTGNETYLLIQDHFQDLLRGRYAEIRKKIDLNRAIQKIAQLALRPTASFETAPAPVIFPDLIISNRGKKWKIEIPDRTLPQFQLMSYEFDDLRGDEKIFVREWSVSAKWIFRCVQRRKEALLKIGAYLVHVQKGYLNQQRDLKTLSAKQVADHLHIHESTVSRALAGKYAETPLGVIPLRSLLTTSPKTQTAKEVLSQLIEEEDQPLTDEELATLLSKKGLPLARRTISKYRKELKIGSARNRPYSFRKGAPK